MQRGGATFADFAITYGVLGLVSEEGGDELDQGGLGVLVVLGAEDGRGSCGAGGGLTHIYY